MALCLQIQSNVLAVNKLFASLAIWGRAIRIASHIAAASRESGHEGFPQEPCHAKNTTVIVIHFHYGA